LWYAFSSAARPWQQVLGGVAEEQKALAAAAADKQAVDSFKRVHAG
jgi:hypothetical protein